MIYNFYCTVDVVFLYYSNWLKANVCRFCDTTCIVFSVRKYLYSAYRFFYSIKYDLEIILAIASAVDNVHTPEYYIFSHQSTVSLYAFNALEQWA